MIPSGPFGGTLYPSPCNRASPKSYGNIFFKNVFQYPPCCQKSDFQRNDLPAAPGRESVVQGGGNTYGQIAGINTVILVQTPC